MSKTEIVSVEIGVQISYDESKFTTEFMQEFRENFYDFDTINEHIQHLCWLKATRQINTPNSFVEGYGHISLFGITFADYS